MADEQHLSKAVSTLKLNEPGGGCHSQEDDGGSGSPQYRENDGGFVTPRSLKDDGGSGPPSSPEVDGGFGSPQSPKADVGSGSPEADDNFAPPKVDGCTCKECYRQKMENAPMKAKVARSKSKKITPKTLFP